MRQRADEATVVEVEAEVAAMPVDMDPMQHQLERKPLFSKKVWPFILTFVLSNSSGQWNNKNTQLNV